jgi:hypothetical protein
MIDVMLSVSAFSIVVPVAPFVIPIPITPSQLAGLGAKKVSGIVIGVWSTPPRVMTKLAERIVLPTKLTGSAPPRFAGRASPKPKPPLVNGAGGVPPVKPLGQRSPGPPAGVVPVTRKELV